MLRIVCEEFILFYKDLNIFKNCDDDEKMKEIFKEMVKTYIIENSPFQLNVLGTKLKEIANTTDPNREVFEPITGEVMKMIKNEIFYNFRRTKEMNQFIQKKKNEIENQNQNHNKN